MRSGTEGKFGGINPLEGKPFDARQERTLETARKNLDEHRFDMKSFVSLYTVQGVLDDVRYVNGKERRLKEELSRQSLEEHQRQEKLKELATLCEWVVFRDIHIKKALGANVFGRVTSHYDDWKNGVDQVYQFKEDAGSSYLGLAIDITFSGKKMGEKMTHIKNDIHAGHLSQVKYFEDVDRTFKGELTNVPRVVVGFDNERVSRILNLSNEGNETSPEESFIHDGLLYEISLQLEHYTQFADKVGKKDLARIYERNLMLVKRAMNQSSHKIDPKRLEEDRVLSAIRENLSLFK